ncbi:hypothetical protein NNC19_20470 [Clostridium sp. SHJSY1]|uniref:hypothetical protein n=1 Tax=Clostridium sp. SHJSY1 TaxID=2942483 RepID=UPI0028755151|nr:hypothetical protein [Clostridium sp. SHJSY1]MDS0528073.1 hypothetical protein [Clostridium sp. SHJSY1]
MINIRKLNDSNSQVEFADMLSEVNIYETLSGYDKSRADVTVECDYYNTIKVLDNKLVYTGDGYKHYINLDDLTVVTFKKYSSGFDANSETAYLYDTFSSYNSERAVEVEYFGRVEEIIFGMNKFIVLEDNQYVHLINTNKLSVVVIKNI